MAMMRMAMRAAPDLVGASGSFEFGALVQEVLALVAVADGANAPSGGRSGAARLMAGQEVCQ